MPGASEGEVMYNECRHIKDDGQRCHAAALKTKPYCFFHMKFDRMHRRDSALRPQPGG